jgi:hypothetical protein
MTIQEMSLEPPFQRLHQFVVRDFQNEFYLQLSDIIPEDKEIGKSYGDLIDFWTKCESLAGEEYVMRSSLRLLKAFEVQENENHNSFMFVPCIVMGPVAQSV